MKQVAAAASRAAKRIDGVICKTPLVQSPVFSSETGTDIYLKLENLQHTGSFKLRGATNRLMTLSGEQRSNGCVTASSGNHGAAVACAMQKLEVSGVIFVPEQTSSVKIEAIRSFGGDVRFFGSDGLETEQHAREFAEHNSMVYLSPYNDAEVIAGQATCGIEIAEQLPDVDAVFIAVGGGGLASGVGSVLRRHNPGVKIYGCQPRASAIMARSIEAGRIVDLPSDPTLSDGTAGGIEADAITFELCRELIDEFILVSEEEIANAMRLFINAHGQVIEGAAGVAIAAMLACPELIAGKKVTVIVCGGNVSQETLESIQIDS
ncbi:MAG: threonine/serine dehydratase [Proteobacteria bacterium]|nr:threonine/serine dehydratase [Pseudomonadota bacterium]